MHFTENYDTARGILLLSIIMDFNLVCLNGLLVNMDFNLVCLDLETMPCYNTRLKMLFFCINKEMNMVNY
jgi:hypothetical protein